MKKLYFNNKDYIAHEVVKTTDSIIGYDENNNEVFAFGGVSDFSLFILEDELGNIIDYSLPKPTEEETIKDLKLALAESFEKQERDKTELQLVIAQMIENGGTING